MDTITSAVSPLRQRMLENIRSLLTPIL